MTPHKLNSMAIGPGRRPRRFWALVLVCLSLVGQYSGFNHLLTVRHALCPEHGEVVHRPYQGAASEAASVPSLDTRQSVRRAAGGSSAEHEHEHCFLLAQRRGQSIPRLAPKPLPSPSPASTQRLTFQESRCVIRIALLRLAPKNSPPV